jgi:hypothetical protein
VFGETVIAIPRDKALAILFLYHFLNTLERP